MSLRVKPRLSVTSNDAAIEAVMHGIGSTRLLSYQIAPYPASGQLQTILSPPRYPFHIVHREGRYASQKVRSFVDFMVSILRSDKTLN